MRRHKRFFFARLPFAFHNVSRTACLIMCHTRFVKTVVYNSRCMSRTRPWTRAVVGGGLRARARARRTLRFFRRTCRGPWSRREALAVERRPQRFRTRHAKLVSALYFPFTERAAHGGQQTAQQYQVQVLHGFSHWPVSGWDFRPGRSNPACQ